MRKVWGMMVFSVSSTTTQLRNVRVRLDGRWLCMDGNFAFATVWVIDYDNGVCVGQNCDDLNVFPGFFGKELVKIYLDCCVSLK